MEHVETLEKLVREGKLSEALDFIESLSPVERQQWQVQNLTGIVCALCGQPKEAHTFFEAALKQRPDDPELLYNLADTCASIGMGRKAKELLERCRQRTEDRGLWDDIAAL